jgi:ech hydrogenase subunit D
MNAEQKIIPIEPDQLAAEALKLKQAGYRLDQVCCTRLENGFELHYSFQREHDFTGLKFSLPPDASQVPGLSAVYPNAFIYENELQDLFGIQAAGMDIDYEGKFYRTRIKWPYREQP